MRTGGSKGQTIGGEGCEREGWRGEERKEALRVRSMRCSPAVHFPNLKRRSTNDFHTRLLWTGLMEAEKKGCTEKVEKLCLSAAMHIDGRRSLRKLAFNGIKNVVKAEMGGKWSQNEAFNAGMHKNGEGFYCGNLDYETWENKLYSSWVNECTQGMHPWEELCFTVSQNE